MRNQNRNFRQKIKILMKNLNFGLKKMKILMKPVNLKNQDFDEKL